MAHFPKQYDYHVYSVSWSRRASTARRAAGDMLSQLLFLGGLLSGTAEQLLIDYAHPATALQYSSGVNCLMR